MRRWNARAVFTILALLGCAGTGSHPAQDGRPSDAVHYEAQLPAAGDRSVLITVRMPTGEGASTTLALGSDEEWGDRNVDRLISDVAAVDGHGRPLPLVRTGPTGWTVRHEQGAALTVRYRLDKSDELPGHCRLVGANALLYPKQHPELPRRVSFRWTGREMDRWTVASSFGLESEVAFVQSRRGFEHAQFLAAAELVLVHRQVLGKRLVLARVGRQWSFPIEEVADVSARTLAAARRLFRDPGPAFFLIAVLPRGEYNEARMRVSGSVATNSVAINLQPPARYDRFADLLHSVIVHEVLHTWLGMAMPSGEPDPQIAWFNEGFTTYFTRKLLYQTDLMTLEQLVADLNRVSERYRQSPVRHVPNARIATDFFRDDSIADVAYLRGDLVALRAEHEIHRGSSGRTLLDFVLGRLAAARSGSVATTEGLIQALAAETSPEFGRWLRAVVLHGDEIQLPPDVLSPCLELEAAEQVSRFRVGRASACAARL